MVKNVKFTKLSVSFIEMQHIYLSKKLKKPQKSASSKHTRLNYLYLVKMFKKRYFRKTRRIQNAQS